MEACQQWKDEEEEKNCEEELGWNTHTHAHTPAPFWRLTPGSKTKLISCVEEED